MPSRTASQISTLSGRVATCENNTITGGSFASNTLTLNRTSGNLQIGGFPSAGAQSVDMSLKDSTLTVNVDGHSDSISLQSIEYSGPAITGGHFSYDSQGSDFDIKMTFTWTIVNPDIISGQTATISAKTYNINGPSNRTYTADLDEEDLFAGTWTSIGTEEYKNQGVINGAVLKTSGGLTVSLQNNNIR